MCGIKRQPELHSEFKTAVCSRQYAVLKALNFPLNVVVLTISDKIRCKIDSVAATLVDLVDNDTSAIM